MGSSPCSNSIGTIHSEPNNIYLWTGWLEVGIIRLRYHRCKVTAWWNWKLILKGLTGKCKVFYIWTSQFIYCEVTVNVTIHYESASTTNFIKPFSSLYFQLLLLTSILRPFYKCILLSSLCFKASAAKSTIFQGQVSNENRQVGWVGRMANRKHVLCV